MRLDAERLALLDGDVATILGTSWTTLPNTSVVGTNQRFEAGQSMSALPGYFRHQLAPLLQGRHLLRCPGI
jgi:hypothetical protein